jgi:Domain of unknown function (DUF4160)
VPTIARVGPYRLFFYSADGAEPAHVHVERDRAIAKYWLRPVRLAHSRGFAAAELRTLERLIMEREAALLEAWHEYFDA